VSNKSLLEEQLKAQLADYGLPQWESNYHFYPGRRLEMDVAWPKYKVGIEVQGGIWIKGGHSSGTGLLRDYEKLMLANELGWQLFFVASNMLDDLSFIKTFAPWFGEHMTQQELEERILWLEHELEKMKEYYEQRLEALERTMMEAMNGEDY
jgi:hypothetical protein